jgi:hypothetical protein
MIGRLRRSPSTTTSSTARFSFHNRSAR